MKWRIEKLSQGSNEVPMPRSGHRIVTFNGQIFSFGGYNPNSGNSSEANLFQELWKFNLITNQWTKIEITGDVPSNLASHSARFCMINNTATMIVYGGTGVPFGLNSSNSVFLCNLTDGNWTKLQITNNEHEDENVPTPLYGQAICLVQNRYLYTIGGTTGHEYHMDIHKLDLNTKTWTLLHQGRRGFDVIDNAPLDPSPR